jgi:hypothetical protein
MTKAQPFTLLSRFPEGVELRHYPAHTLVSVEVTSDFESAGNISFRPLVSYISGANDRGGQMAMTSPVVQAPQKDLHVMSFVLPEGVDASRAPLPTDSRVTVHDVAPREVAALRFSGSWKKSRAEDNAARLLEVLGERGITTVGEVFYGRFDPPAVPGFLRHNEALVEVTNLNP